MAMMLASRVSENVGTILLASLMLGAAFLVLAVGVWYYRRWQAGHDRESTAPWTFDDLRKLREQGKLTDEEYHALRASMIGFHAGEVPSKPAQASSPDVKPAEESWDWVAEGDPRQGGFDLKKAEPD